MPTKTASNGSTYQVSDKTFTWTTEDGEQITIPLRIKLKVIRSLGERDLNADTMFEMLESLVPKQADALDEMDVNDFQAMFTTWQSEYNALTGATLGEAEGSPR